MNILFIISKGQPKPNIQYHSSTLLLFFIIFLLSPLYSSHPLLVKAQNFATLDSDSDPYFTAGIALTAIAVISFSVYIVIYLCFRRFFQPWAERNRGHPSHTGIDPLILRTFPVINFTDHILDLKPSKGLAECAVCLGLFERGETLRVLPKCGHVFHVGCVDPWLASHTTCPLCRANLVLGSDELAQVESGCVAGLGCEVVEVNEVDDNNVVVPMSREVVGVQPGTIWRWNSTGHVARFDGMKDEEKSTVVRKDIIVKRELNRTKSCTIINMDLDDG